MSLLPRIRPCLLSCFILLLAGLITACNRSFHLSESEVAAYSASIRTQQDAASLFAPLAPSPQSAGSAWTIQFTPAGNVQSSNLPLLLRSTRLGLTEQLFRQIDLDRLSSQIHQNIDTWVSNNLRLLRRDSDNLARLDSLSSATVRFLSPPTFTYRSDLQQIQFDMTLRVSTSGVLQISDPDGFLGFIPGLFIPDGRYPLTVTINNYRLRGQIILPRTPSDPRAVRLVINPVPGSVSVSGSAPSDVRTGVQLLFRTLLSGQVNETYSLSFDYFEMPYVRLTSAPTNRLETTYTALPKQNDPILDVVARDATGKLHHSRRFAGRWSPFSQIPLTRTVATDPVLVASGPDQLELAAVASNGDLVFTSWRESTWGNRFVSVPDTEYDIYANKKPALVATAPGQLELFALRGYDGTFVHLRRLNGQWLPPAEVGDTARAAQPRFRDPVAVQAGNKIVLIYADRTDQLFAAAFDLESGVWSQSQRISHSPGWTHFAPTAASCGDGRVDVVYVGRTQVPYHVALTIDPGPLNANSGGFSYSPSNAIGGALTESPVLTCSGYRRMELIGRGTDNRLYLNHFVSAEGDPVGTVEGRPVVSGWRGWTDASDRMFGTAVLRNVVSPAIVSTRAGQLHVVGRQLPSAFPQNLFHNSYDSLRYGRAPWRAVHWRGFERIATNRFVGTPALAVTDRQADFALVGSSLGLWTSSLRDASLPAFANVSATSLHFPYDPVVLSSSPGIVDVLFTAADGTPRHVRRINGVTTRTFTLPGSITSPVTAVTFGSGQIELIARGGDNALYHWRFRNGAWSSWTRLGGSVISVPVLMHTGAGQLELFAVGNDSRVYRWRFAAGQWAPFAQLPSDFSVSAVMFGPSAFSSWGDGTVDFVVVEDGAARMFHRRIAQQTSPTGFIAGFTAIGGTVTDTPALTAFGPFRLNILVPGTDFRLYSTWSSRDQLLVPAARPRTPGLAVRPTYTLGNEILRWTPFELVGPPRVFIGSVSRLNDREIVALAFDPQGIAYTNRFVAARWTAFLPLQGQTSAQRHAPPFRPILAQD